MQRFSAIIIEQNTDLNGFPSDLNRHYRHCPQMLLSGVPSLQRKGTGQRKRAARREGQRNALPGKSPRRRLR